MTANSGTARAAAARVKFAREKPGRQRDSHKPGFDPAESPIAWLARRKDKDGNPLLPQPEFDAGERLRADFHFAQLMPQVTSSWSGLSIDKHCRRSAPGSGVELSDRTVAAKERVARALAAVGPDLSGILIDVCCHLKGLESIERAAQWPNRSGKIVLRLALSSLARHYGLIRPEPSGRTGPTVIRQWGAPGYRPAMADAGANLAKDGENGEEESP